MRTEIKKTGNPYSHDGPELINIATKAVFDKKIDDVGRVYDIGSHLYSDFKKRETHIRELYFKFMGSC